jgi:hypothetical protein
MNKAKDSNCLDRRPFLFVLEGNKAGHFTIFLQLIEYALTLKFALLWDCHAKSQK